MTTERKSKEKIKEEKWRAILLISCCLHPDNSVIRLFRYVLKPSDQPGNLQLKQKSQSSEKSSNWYQKSQLETEVSLSNLTSKFNVQKALLRLCERRSQATEEQCVLCEVRNKVKCVNSRILDIAVLRKSTLCSTVVVNLKRSYTQCIT